MEQNEDLTIITKPKQTKFMHQATPTLYLNTANLRLVYKLEMKNNGEDSIKIHVFNFLWNYKG